MNRLAALFLAALLAGILSSPAAQKTSLVVGIVVASVLALTCHRRHSQLESARRMAAATAEAARRCSSTLLLQTITHFSRIERLVRRPGGLSSSQDTREPAGRERWP